MCREFLSKAGASRKPRRQQDEGNDKLKRWSNNFSRRKLSRRQMIDFWKDAVDMVDGSDPDVIVEVMEKLAEDTMGRTLIEQVLRSDYAGEVSSTGDLLMASMCFIWFMTHRETISNFSIEKNVNSLYAYFYGTGGKQTASFFADITLQLSNEIAAENRKSKLWVSKILGRRFSFSHALARVVEFLRHTLRRNRVAELCEPLKEVIGRLSTLSTPIPSHDKFYPSITDSLQEITCIQWQTTGTIGSLNAGVASPVVGTVLQTSLDGAEVDYPGCLSRFGTRHDNDFAKIHRIKLLPTINEIMSKRQDYLPSRAHSAPHFLTGLDRLLDTHFRLLRYDYIQEVKNAVRGVFEVLSMSPARGKRERAIHKLEASSDNRWFLYSEVSVESAEFDIQGLQLQLSFCKPSPAMYENWDESKRLKTGTLACLISCDDGLSRVTFVTISDKRGQGGYQVWGKYRGVVAQVVESADHYGLKFLFQQVSDRQKPRSQFLLEFGGVIPSHFLPILRNIQELSFRGTHPIGRWVLPSNPPPVSGTTSGGHESLVGSRKEKEFRWDLKPILRNPGSTLALGRVPTLSASEEVEALEQATVLNLEQCKGLVAGLSQGMSLIEGAPSTGKGFVGLQLVRVLIQNKPQKPIGPIICLYAIPPVP